ncbi:MAG TPA: dienelactone hydrolase family protein [Vicinamibacterales bacterium]|nr:dienelactone hydrolase family protein [Vicinamibacterales bacterium]
MCDENFEHDLENYSRFPHVTRRQLGALSIGAGMTFMLPRSADAQAVTESDVTITTPDGEADSYFVHPARGASPGVLIWPDILGLRPAFRQMGKRLAESGYAVLVVNPFYRSKKAPVVQPGASFADPATRDIVMPMAQALNATTHVTDAKAFVAWLDSQAAVDKNRKIGTTGYCMGGPMVMRTAAAVPDRVGAGGSFHGGGLVTKDADSPHLLVPKMKAHFLFAVAENDDQRDPAAKNVLKETFAKANLPAEIEVYAAAHGWCPPDSAVYNEKLAERAWARLLVLFKTALA